MAKKRANDNLDELRRLTKRQRLQSERTRKDIIEARWLIENAQCPSDYCQGAGVCDWCKRAGKWLEETK